MSHERQRTGAAIINYQLLCIHYVETEDYETTRAFVP